MVSKAESAVHGLLLSDRCGEIVLCSGDQVLEVASTYREKFVRALVASASRLIGYIACQVHRHLKKTGVRIGRCSL